MQLQGERRPRIGLTARTVLLKAARKTRPAETVTRLYVEVLESLGALPVILPSATDAALAKEYLASLDGVLLTGGDDVHPAFFGEEPHPKIEAVDERRDRFELALVLQAYREGTPLLGICRGIQVLNVALGGTLYQDIPAQEPSAVGHAQLTVEEGPWHTVEVEKGSVLAGVLGLEGRLAVNSFHHQACRTAGKGLAIAARTAADGLIEALEARDRPFCLGVQWHPEIPASAGDEPSIRLFAAFVNAAREAACASSKGCSPPP